MAKIEDWHSRAADQVVRYFLATPTQGKIEVAAEIIASHTPASTAPKEVVEKYARTITVNSPDIIKEFDAGVGVSGVATDILTRFASEIGVDAETEALLLAVAEWHQAWEKEGARPDIYRLAVEKLADYYKRFINKQINAALKAAGGGK